MNPVRCNYCSQVVQFILMKGNAVCPVCRQSSTSCCEGDSCTIVYNDKKPTPQQRPERTPEKVMTQGLLPAI